jgi:hypothetical protein
MYCYEADVVLARTARRAEAKPRSSQSDLKLRQAAECMRK